MSDRILTHISGGGRVVIPTIFRKKFGMEEGSAVIMTADESGVRIVTPGIALRKLQDIAEERLPPEKRGLIVDEFISERRAENEKE